MHCIIKENMKRRREKKKVKGNRKLKNEKEEKRDGERERVRGQYTLSGGVRKDALYNVYFSPKSLSPNQTPLDDLDSS